MSDRIQFTFSDATVFTVEVGAGGADATVEAIIHRNGEFATGWVKDAANDGRLYNLGAAIRMDVQRVPDSP
jgi:hypothetical protein